MEAKLIVVGGKANKAEVVLALPAVIGRGRDADLTVAHATVSRRHCLIYEKDGALIVRDNGSLNGTVIEGARITEAVLRPGETLTVGPLTFRAEYEHFGAFPSLGEQPTLPNVHETISAKHEAAADTVENVPPVAPAVAPAATIAAAESFDFLKNKNDEEMTPESARAGSESELPQLPDPEPSAAGALESSAVAEDELELNLPELDPPAAEEAPSFGFLSEPVESPTSEAAADLPVPPAQDDSASFGFLSEATAAVADEAAIEAPDAAPVESALAAGEPVAEEADDDYAEAPLALGAPAEAAADSAEFAGLDFLADDDAAGSAAKDDSANFGFLGAMDEKTAGSGPDSLPEITLHDAEEPPPAADDSGEYALSTEPIAAPPSFSVADELAGDEERLGVKNGKHRDAAEPLPADEPAATVKLDEEPAAGKKKGWFGFGKSKAAAPATPEMPSPAPAAPAEPSPAVAASAIKTPAAASETDIDAAALDFLSDSPASGAEAKPSKPAKPAEVLPKINAGPEGPKAAAPEDDELNNFFESIGLE